jgi:hypothetical protein
MYRKEQTEKTLTGRFIANTKNKHKQYRRQPTCFHELHSRVVVIRLFPRDRHSPITVAPPVSTRYTLSFIITPHVSTDRVRVFVSKMYKLSLSYSSTVARSLHSFPSSLVSIFTCTPISDDRSAPHAIVCKSAWTTFVVRWDVLGCVRAHGCKHTNTDCKLVRLCRHAS